MKKSNINRKAPPKKTNKGRKKKSKVYIPMNSIIALSAIVVFLCSMLLLVNAVSAAKAKSNKNPVSAPVEISKKRQTSENIKHQENVSKVLQNPENVHKTDETDKADKKSIKKQSEKNGSVKKNNAEVTSEKTKEKTSVHPVSEKTELKPPVASDSKKPETVTLQPPESQTNQKVQPSTEKPKTAKSSDIPPIPQAAPGAKLVIIFDDGGQNLNQLEKCVTLPFPVTVAVLPRLAHSKEAAVRVRASGNELILHQPMQSVNPNVNPGAGAIKPGMSEDEIKALLFQNINEIAPITGMNNHEGSLITANADQMSYVMKACSDEGIYFLDSRTNVETKVPYVARALGYSYYERNVFLDNKKVRADIISEIMKGIAIANKKGVAIMIGHVWSAEILPGILAEMYPLLVEKGYRFTTVSNSGALITQP